MVHPHSPVSLDDNPVILVFIGLAFRPLHHQHRVAAAPMTSLDLRLRPSLLVHLVRHLVDVLLTLDLGEANLRPWVPRRLLCVRTAAADGHETALLGVGPGRVGPSGSFVGARSPREEAVQANGAQEAAHAGQARAHDANVHLDNGPQHKVLEVVRDVLVVVPDGHDLA